MKIYRVGGSVRDEILGHPVADRDYVVVGASPEEMRALGYLPVGRDFPVFLDPVHHEEYALARSERKQGRGHRGFVFHATPDVTLEQDLMRRDLTINAMARDADGSLIDPFGGTADLERGILRHVSPAFVEDPLRVLRVARFAARFAFTVAPETRRLMRKLATSGELESLSPERVWQEISRALMEPYPSRLLTVLRDCGALAKIMPEVDALAGETRSEASTNTSDAALAAALDYAAGHGFDLAARYALLSLVPGRATSVSAERQKQRAYEMHRLRLTLELAQRLKVPTLCRDVAQLAVRWRSRIHSAATLLPAEVLDMLMAMDALRRPERLDSVLDACEAECQSQPGATPDPYAPARLQRAAYQTLRAVSVGAIARQAAKSGDRGDVIAHAIRAVRLKALRAWRAELRRATGIASR